MTEKKRKIHVVGINSYKFEDLSFKLQNLFQETVSIAVPNSYFEEIKSWSENGLEKKKLFFSSNSNKELVKWLRSQKTDVILISRGDPLWFGIGRILLENFSKDELSIGLFPGSRFPEILDNFALILKVLEAMSDLRYFQKIQFNFAIVNALSSLRIKEIFQKRGWLKIENIKDNNFLKFQYKFLEVNINWNNFDKI